MTLKLRNFRTSPANRPSAFALRDYGVTCRPLPTANHPFSIFAACPWRAKASLYHFGQLPKALCNRTNC